MPSCAGAATTGAGNGADGAGRPPRPSTNESVAWTRRRSCSTHRLQLRRCTSSRRTSVPASAPSMRSEISPSARSHQPLPPSVTTVWRSSLRAAESSLPTSSGDAPSSTATSARGRSASTTRASAWAATGSSAGSHEPTSRTAVAGSTGPGGRDGTGRSGACSMSGREDTSAGGPRLATLGAMSEYAKDVLVDTQWVENHLSDENIRIVEVDENPALYAEAHIPGAIGLDWQKDLQDQVKRDFLGPKEFGELFGGRGVSNEHTIVLYGDRNNWFAAYTYWYLKYYGHDNVKLMNGPREKWISEGRPTSTEVPSFDSESFSASEGDKEIRAYRDEVLGVLDSSTKL